MSQRGFVTSLSLMLFILAFFVIQMYGKAYRESGYDFTSYLLSSRAFLEGSSPYQTGSPFPFIYPLFLCVVLLPFTLLPYWLSNVLWFAANSAALWFAAVLLLRLVSDSLPWKPLVAILLLPFLILLNVIQNSLLNGQVNFLVVLMCTLFLTEHLRGRRFSSSVFLAAAVALKLTPAIFFAYLLLRRDLATTAMALFNSVLLIAAVPYLVGGSATFLYYDEYVRTFLLDKLQSAAGGAHVIEFSLTSIVRFFGSSLPASVSLAIAGACALAPIAFLQFTMRGKENGFNQTVIFSLYMLAILLISPISETHHLINLLPAVVLMSAALILSTRGHFKRSGIFLAVVLASLMLAKVYFPSNLVAIGAAYGFLVWTALGPFDGPFRPAQERRAAAQ